MINHTVKKHVRNMSNYMSIIFLCSSDIIINWNLVIIIVDYRGNLDEVLFEDILYISVTTSTTS